MGAYIARRLMLMIPTLFGILLLSFTVIQFAPGGPVEQVLAQISGQGSDGLERLAGNSSDFADSATNETEQIQKTINTNSKYRGAKGLDPEFIAKLEKQFGFDKPPIERFIKLTWDYIRFEFGESYFRSISVLDLIIEKMPVSISLGLWITLLSYGVSIPLGIRKAVRDSSPFDVWTSAVIVVAYAVPGFLVAILLIVLFAGGSFLDWFPLRGLVSENFNEMSVGEKIIDYFWHLTLPLFAMALAAFATATLLTKNSFLDEIKKQYVITARAKGLSEKRILYMHVFRNAMLIIIAGFPAAFISAFFTGSLLIEAIFSLDGLGLLGYKATIQRDYPVVFANLYIFSLIGLVVALISDLLYTAIDPRIDFEKRDL